MNILLDTNIIIPLEDTSKILDSSFAELRKLSAEQHHCLYIHPMQFEDINRDKNQPFFESLRQSYVGFDERFQKCAEDKRKCWCIEDGDSNVAAICIYIPIRPQYHEDLLPDFSSMQGSLFEKDQSLYSCQGNTIKKAYLCHSRIKSIRKGDIVLFYRSKDRKSIQCMGYSRGYSVFRKYRRSISCHCQENRLQLFGSTEDSGEKDVGNTFPLCCQIRDTEIVNMLG